GAAPSLSPESLPQAVRARARVIPMAPIIGAFRPAPGRFVRMFNILLPCSCFLLVGGRFRALVRPVYERHKYRGNAYTGSHQDLGGIDESATTALLSGNRRLRIGVCRVRTAARRAAVAFASAPTSRD